MSRRILCAFLIVALSVAITTVGQTTTPGQKKSAQQDDFKSLIDRYYAAWNTGNPDNAAPLYAQVKDLVFYDLTPLKYTGCAEYDAGVRQVLASFASAKFTPQLGLLILAGRLTCSLVQPV